MDFQQVLALVRIQDVPLASLERRIQLVKSFFNHALHIGTKVVILKPMLDLLILGRFGPAAPIYCELLLPGKILAVLLPR